MSFLIALDISSTFNIIFSAPFLHILACICLFGSNSIGSRPVEPLYGVRGVECLLPLEEQEHVQGCRSQICEHKHQIIRARARKKCGGTSICLLSRKRSKCKDCLAQTNAGNAVLQQGFCSSSTYHVSSCSARCQVASMYACWLFIRFVC